MDKSSLKIFLIVILIIVAGYFVYKNYADRQLGQVGLVGYQAAASSCLPLQVTDGYAPNYVLPINQTDIHRFSVINQNPVGSNCAQKLKSVDLAYVSTGGILFHNTLTITGAGTYGSSSTYNSAIGGFHINMNQNVVPVLQPGAADDLYVVGTPNLSSPTASYRGLMIGVGSVEYREGTVQSYTIQKTFPNPIPFGTRWTVQ